MQKNDIQQKHLCEQLIYLIAKSLVKKTTDESSNLRKI